MESWRPNSTHQTLIGVGALLLAVMLAVGAIPIRSGAGYAGIGPNFLPWAMAVALGLCGILLIRDARRGGWRKMEPPSGAARGDWRALAWVSAGVLVNASLVTTLGFVLSCALCFTLAVRGLRGSEGRPAGGWRQTGTDFVTGMLIAGPTFWLFTKMLGINLPGLTGTGWL